MLLQNKRTNVRLQVATITITFCSLSKPLILKSARFPGRNAAQPEAHMPLCSLSDTFPPGQAAGLGQWNARLMFFSNIKPQ